MAFGPPTFGGRYKCTSDSTLGAHHESAFSCVTRNVDSRAERYRPEREVASAVVNTMVGVSYLGSAVEIGGTVRTPGTLFLCRRGGYRERAC